MSGKTVNKFVQDTIKQLILEKFSVFVEKVMAKLTPAKQIALTEFLVAMQARFDELSLDFTEADLKAMLQLIKDFVAGFNVIYPKMTCKLLKVIKKLVKDMVKLVLVDTDKLYRCVVKHVYTEIMKLLECLQKKYHCHEHHCDDHHHDKHHCDDHHDKHHCDEHHHDKHSNKCGCH